MSINPKKFILSLRKLDRKSFKNRFRFSVLIFATLVSLYLGLIQSDRYASSAKIVVSQLSNFDNNSVSISNIISGNSSKTEDASIISEYIRSQEMMQYLDEKVDLRKIFSRDDADFFSALAESADEDDLYNFYLQHLSVKISNDSAIINVEVQGFIPEDAEKILGLLIKQSELFINKISKETARQQLDFIRREVVISEERIIEVQEDLQKIQEKFNAPDPTAEVLSTVNLISDLEKQLSLKRIDMEKTLNANPKAQVVAMKSEIKAIENEIQTQKKRVIKKDSDDITENMNMLFEYKNAERKLEFAVEAHRAALAAQEKVRTTSAQNLKKLVVITGPTTESEASYPKRLYNLAFFLCVLGLVYYIIKATYSAIITHKAIQ